jgi:hypothetical protein
MDTLTEPVRREQRRFADRIETIKQAADAVGVASLPELRTLLDTVSALLQSQFLPHARAGEETLYPLGRRVLDGDHISDAKAFEHAFEHAEVKRLTQKLSVVRERLVYSYFGPAQFQLLREVLYDLYAILSLHLSEEEGISLPLLDARLRPAGASEVDQPASIRE